MNPQPRLRGKVALVTGAGTGIGEAIAHKFALEGAHLLLNGLPGDPVEDVARAIRERYRTEVGVYLGDVAEEEHARACVQAAIDAFGKLDVLVNNAGVYPELAETQDLDVEVYDTITRNNTRSVFLMTKFALPHLQQTRGNVVSAGSEAGFNGHPQMTPYGASKAWVHAFTMGVAVEQAKHGVRANCVCPGATDTAWTHKETGPMNAKFEKTVTGSTPLGRRGTPEEIANVYAFLASDEASFVTGALWLVDGGITPAKGMIGLEASGDVKEQPEGVLELQHAHDGPEAQPPARPVAS